MAGFVGDGDIDGVGQTDGVAEPRIGRAAEDLEGDRGFTQARGDRGGERLGRVIEREFDFGEAELGALYATAPLARRLPRRSG